MCAGVRVQFTEVEIVAEGLPQFLNGELTQISIAY